MNVDKVDINKLPSDVRKTFKQDLDAARVLNISNADLRGGVNRLSGIDVNTIDRNIFRPINISPEIRKAFRDNAAAIGTTSPLDDAQSAIQTIQNEMRKVSLEEPSFPLFENPLFPITQDTPVTPQTLNLPSIDSNIVNNPNAAGSFSNLTTAQKLQLLFPQG